MEAADIPEYAQQVYPNSRIIIMGPPNGLTEEHCYSIPVLLKSVEGEVFDGAPEFHSYWQPSKEELEILNKGGKVELVFIGLFPPTIVGVIGVLSD